MEVVVYNMKSCKQCNRLLDVDSFHKCSKNKSGLHSRCKDCRKKQHADIYVTKKERSKELAKRWQSDNRDKVSKIAKRFYENNKEKCDARSKVYYNNNSERLNEYRRNYRLIKRLNSGKELRTLKHTHIDKKEYARQYRKRNRGLIRYYEVLRKLDIKLRTPKWADLKAIREFYINCPKGYQVDHIIPLRGKIVSGFHIIENLQYLTSEENLRKGNRF